MRTGLVRRIECLVSSAVQCFSVQDSVRFRNATNVPYSGEYSEDLDKIWHDFVRICLTNNNALDKLNVNVRWPYDVDISPVTKNGWKIRRQRVSYTTRVTMIVWRVRCLRSGSSKTMISSETKKQKIHIGIAFNITHYTSCWIFNVVSSVYAC